MDSNSYIWLMKKKLVLLFCLALLGLLLHGSFSLSKVRSPLTVETKKGASGLSNYIIIYKNTAKIDFEIVRPDKKDSSMLLCIAAAFTKLDNFDIDGLYICKGKTGNKNAKNFTLGGAIKIINGECSIFPTAKGKLLTDSLISDVETQKGSLFQQIQMIENGGVATFKDSLLYLRRGILIFKNGKTAIAESTRPITLKTFAQDLSQFGVKDLLYTDMGSWDEGWYRNPSKGIITPLGNNHSQTGKQSNWVVFRR
jgi:hypothetical protein